MRLGGGVRRCWFLSCFEGVYWGLGGWASGVMWMNQGEFLGVGLCLMAVGSGWCV